MSNKVLFGVSNLHIGSYSVSTTGVVTLGTPVKIPGTVNINLEPISDNQKFYADNVVYWSGYSDAGYDGEIENALFPDSFKTQFLNYVTLANGGTAQIKGMNSKKVYMMFQAEGDESARRCILYNVALGQITREYSTIEDTAEPATAKLPFNVSGDAGSGIIKAAYGTDSGVYTTMFTTPPVPALIT